MRYFILIIGFLLEVQLFASQPYNIEVKGNTKTTTFFIENLVLSCLEHLPSKTPEALAQCVKDARLFSEVEVEINGNDIRVQVEDRWTLIPLPFVLIQKDQPTSFGLFFIESNLLGTGTLLVGGVAKSSQETTFILIYRNKSIAFSNWNFGVFSALLEKDVVQLAGDKERDAYTDDAFIIRPELGYQLNAHWSVFLPIGYTRKFFSPLKGFEEPETVRFAFSGARIRFVDHAYKFYFQEGISSDLRFFYQVWREDSLPKAWTINWISNYQKQLFMNQALQFKLTAGIMRGGNKTDALLLGYRKGFRGLPNNSKWTDHHYALSSDYQIPILASKFGTWTVAPFWDLALLRSYQQKEFDSLYQSYGLGTYFFLKKVALPGMGVLYGRNNVSPTFFISASIGMSM